MESTHALDDNVGPLKLVVVGLGYVGLPLLFEAARVGIQTVGLDANAAIVESLASGKSHVDDIDDEMIRECLANGVRFSSDPEVLSEADTIIICVPTPLDADRAPDLSAVLAVAENISAHLHPGDLVVLESTTYPGTTDGVLRTKLEQSGLVAGKDFALAFSPERIDPGNPEFGLVNTPKVVGGLTAACADRAVDLYQRFVSTVVPVAGLREAEMSKLLENTYRHVNIALVNEMAVFSKELGIDLWEAIRAAATKPFGFSAFYPGPGVGGHCIPIDPNYLSYSVRTLGYQFRFVELAQEVSGRMPAYVAHRVQNALNDIGMATKGSRVLLLGLTYKSDIGDKRETPATDVVRSLRSLGADVTGHDPYLDSFEVDDEPIAMSEDLNKSLVESDIVVVLQWHSEYDADAIAQTASLVFDTRGRMRHGNAIRL